MRYTVLAGLMVVAVGWMTADALARGGGGGGGGHPGGARPGGGAHPAASGAHRPGGGAAAHTPSMSRPAGKPVANRPAAPSHVSRPHAGSDNTSRPDLSKKPDLPTKKPELPVHRPEIGAKKPELPTNRPDLAGKKPEIPTNRPDLAGKKPEIPANRPDLTGKKPDLGDNRPHLGDKPGPNGRPDFSGNQRPSTGDLQDFLDMPGQVGAGDRTSIGNKTGLGNKVGNQANLGDRNKTKVGDVNISTGNINTGNQVAINRQNNVNSIRNKYTNVDHRSFNHNTWGPHAGNPSWRWHAGWGVYPPQWGWRPCAWASFGTWFAWQWARPYPYDYGTNVVYRENNVYIDNKQYATSEEYYVQAETIAANVPPNVDEKKVEWMPLGVFAIAEEGAEDTGMMVQLAVSKEGILAGTFFNEIANTSRPIEGMVDRESQRAAWKFADGKNADIVMETGVVNLTKDEATALVHLDKATTQSWLMVRLPAPEETPK